MKAWLLSPGDLLRTADGRWLPVESIADTGDVATVYNFRVAEYHTYYVGSPHWGFAVWSHNSNCVRGAGVPGDDAPSRAADPSAVVNALSGFRSRRFVVDGVTFLLDKSGMKHILGRHCPMYWDGSVKAAQSFFPKNMTIEQIGSAIAEVLKQNRQAVARIGTNGIGSVRGIVNGVEYQLGLNHGRIGQFFPVK